MEEEVILVDENDNELGRMEKMQAHKVGALHRAVSVFIFNGGGQLLLQKRAAEKYHSPGKWSNTCCTHPRPGEASIDAARRRLNEEMGMDCGLTAWGTLLYCSAFDNGLIEHENDHIFIGVTNSVPVVNPAEVEDYQYVELRTLQQSIQQHPDRYTPWLSLCLDKIDLKKKENENPA
ncbi:MAG: isopentenyl-diphosphate Delta-isomerase [Mucilaginibacter sp.]|uniref:isopentenyl-diphosphate Delta-isomerase n=1 Tax=Mucilaginibacter sp. L3T2-6 TaxID=3062491 RepID=UPI0026751206|nr:isopentenyl-diphosphate Delta-isomerase [Mucilaginibacter sp. L3T2-6]MDO3642923.1 isopentenyl-diphosphate Delta-isomerase [Mucilaginibacter sp. L3T2-6]MDV6215248.1 isopentenyl-diphosphate Delta-isomerase [Mucilaginibacter sp. L3T2-6]